MNEKPDNLEIATLAKKIAAGEAACVVVGLGVVGTETVRHMSEAGLQVKGYDRNAEAVINCQRKLSSVVSDSLSSDESVLESADVVLIAVRTPYQNESVDLEPLQQVALALNRSTRRSRLIILQSTVLPGTTRRLANEWLEYSKDNTFLVAHCPERLQEGNAKWTIKTTPRLVGGIDDKSTELAALLLASFCDQVIQVEAPEVSEISKLLENAVIANGVSLVGEVTRLAHAHGISAKSVAQAAATKPYGYLPFWPGAGFGGHCIPNDLGILRLAMAGSQLDSPLLDGVAGAAEQMPADVVQWLESALGFSLNKQEILVVGVGFKPGSADTTASPAAPLVSLLWSHGADVTYLDSHVERFSVDNREVQRVSAEDIGSRSFCAAIVLSADPGFSGQCMESVGLVLDAGREELPAASDYRIVLL